MNMGEKKEAKWGAGRIEQVPTTTVDAVVNTQTGEAYTVPQALAKVLNELDVIRNSLER